MRVAGLLLAAGAGSRMGRPKALVTGTDGVPWVQRAARVLAAGGCDLVHVAVGAAATDVRVLLAEEDVHVVDVPDWERGVAASLVAGLTSLPADVDAVLVHLVDLPDVTPAVVERLRSRAGTDAVARAVYAGEPGHPVLLGRRHWAELVARADGDAGAGPFLSSLGVAGVECGDLATGRDVDSLPRRGGTISDPTELLGEWAFSRHVDDRHAGREMAAEGRLVLEAQDDGGVRWDEQGVLTWDDHTVPVSRTYLLERRTDGWVVLFEDGRDFHPWTPGATVRHDCGADTYVGRVRAGDQGWSVTWDVSGPAKDYTMLTTFTRPGSAGR